jgi:hypothetical protein
MGLTGTASSKPIMAAEQPELSVGPASWGLMAAAAVAGHHLLEEAVSSGRLASCSAAGPDGHQGGS